MNNLVIRNEQKEDYRTVEEVTREAFYNVYVPGCDEHYLVHKLRKSVDFIPLLDFVAETDNKIVGNIVFSKSYIIDDIGNKHDMLTFGPLSVLPDYQNKGIGGMLIEHAKKAACELKYKAILIYGYPDYYKRFGFKHAKEYNITSPEGKYPVAHLVYELYEGALDNITGKAYESEVYNIDKNEAEDFDKLFPAKEKKITDSQKKFERTAAMCL